MGKSKGQGELFVDADAGDDTTVINERCLLRRDGGDRIVLADGIVLAHIGAGDRLAEAHASVLLVENGWAHQVDVARVFECSARTLRRRQERLDQGGLAALGRPCGYPRGRERLPGRDERVADLKARGLSNRAIAQRLGVHEKAVRKRLRRLGLQPRQAQQMSLSLPASRPEPAAAQAPGKPVAVEPNQGADPNLSASAEASVGEGAENVVQGADPNLSAIAAPTVEEAAPETAAPLLAGPAIEAEPVPGSADNDPTDRRFDRMLAHAGFLQDAAPMFREGRDVPAAGVLLALPCLVHSGAFATARKTYGSIGPAFYGLRTTMLTMLLMALGRIKRPENLKEHSPPDLGRVLGLDRAPEVKTLRRKLTHLALLRGAEQLGRSLAQRRAVTHGDVLGFLYIDGHVRIYHGKREIPKAHAARIRLSMPGTTDYWVNDARGDPLFVVTAEANAGLVKMLPALLDAARPLLGARRATIVFDRGGWSQKLFKKLVDAGFDILTYRKGRSRRVPARAFSEHIATFDGREVRYQLADQTVRLSLGKKQGVLELRQVTRLQDGHQTPVLTSRTDMATVEVAYRMFARWRQENFFKYMREEFLLDALVDYQVEPDDPDRDVPNPAWATVDAKLKGVLAEIDSLEQRYGLAALMNPESKRPSMRGFKIRHGKLGKQIRGLWRKARTLEERRAAIPRRIPVGQRTKGEVIKLATERKHLTDLIKMLAYQAESDLVRAVAPHYSRTEEEGRTLVQTALRCAADIDVTDTELRVTLAPLSSGHRTRAVASLCELLDATETIFPGTRLRVRYAIRNMPAPVWTAPQAHNAGGRRRAGGN